MSAPFNMNGTDSINVGCVGQSSNEKAPCKWVQKQQPNPNSNFIQTKYSPKFDLKRTDLPPDSTWDVFQPISNTHSLWNNFLDEVFGESNQNCKEQMCESTRLFLPKDFVNIKVNIRLFGAFKR